MDASWEVQVRRDTYYHGLWPKNKRPPPAVITKWKAALSKVFLQDVGRTLLTPLGRWHTAMDRDWNLYYSPSDLRAYQRNGSSWSVWQKIPLRSTCRDHYRFLHEENHLPDDVVRASGYFLRERLVIASTCYQGCTPPPPHTAGLPFLLHLQGLDSDKSWSTQRCKMECDEEQLAQALIHNRLVVISDGSFDKGIGTAAFRLEDETNRLLGLEGTLRAPGRSKDMESQRAELAGLYGGITVVEELVKHHQVTGASVEVGCDNEGALRIFDLEYVFDPTQSDYDLLSSLQHRLRTSSLRWVGRHVKGHQDDFSDAELDDWALRNIQMDAMAKERLKEELQSVDDYSYQGSFASEGWSLWADGQKWSEVKKADFLYHIHFPRTIEYWVSMGRFPAEIAHRIDWSIVGPALQRLPASKRRWVSKHAANQCGVGATLVRWEYQVDSDCPRCGQPEDTEHVSLCRSPSADGTWVKGLNLISSWMELKATLPSLRIAVLTCLDQWHQQLPYTPLHYDWPGLNNAIAEQDAIGWNHFLMGLLSPAWGEVQDSYYWWLGKRNTGKRWASLLITKLLQTAWDMWDDRTSIRHAPDNPRQRKAVTALDKAITDEMRTGVGLLPPSMWHFFEQPLRTILSKQVRAKKQWLSSIEAARRYASQIDTRWH